MILTIRINYDTPELYFVLIKVYSDFEDVNKPLIYYEKSTGSYKVEFSAKGGSASGGDAYTLPSGIYFYRL